MIGKSAVLAFWCVVVMLLVINVIFIENSRDNVSKMKDTSNTNDSFVSEEIEMYLELPLKCCYS